MPAILETNGRLTLTLSNLGESQTLFMVRDSRKGPELMGVLMYCRTAADTLTLIHLAVLGHDESGSREISSHESTLGIRLVARAVSIARQIKGVAFVVLPYSTARLRVGSRDPN